MVYRNILNTDVSISQLGFGCMRLPLIDIYDPTAIDEERAVEMFRYAVEHGLNYFDTAHPYHRETSERLMGTTLSRTYRDRIFLATKLPMWHVKSPEDCDRLFKEQSQRLQTDCIDVYLLHALNKRSWKTVQECDIQSFLDGLKKKANIR